jgi:hypothetical protein
MNYVLLEAEMVGNGSKQILISEDDYNNDPTPSHYFNSRYCNARKLGEVQIIDNDNILRHIAYESCM